LSFGVLLSVGPLAAQGTRGLALIPFLGAGSRSGEWPVLYLGGQVEPALTGRLRLGFTAAAWGTPLVCTPSGDPDTDRTRCAQSGWLADIGLRGWFVVTGGLQGYGGAGAGVMRVGENWLAPHLVLGADLRARSGVGLRVEARYQRLLSAPSPDFVTIMVGVRFR
jgi:hypothetical protein